MIAQGLWLVLLKLNGVGAAPQLPLEDMLVYLLDNDKFNQDMGVLIAMC